MYIFTIALVLSVAMMSLKLDSKALVVAGTLPKLVHYLASEELPGTFVFNYIHIYNYNHLFRYYRYKLH